MEIYKAMESINFSGWLQIISLIFAAGIVYAKLINIEKIVSRMENHGDRITRLETQIQNLIEHKLKNEK
jgi:hypothetical protein